MGRLAAPRPFLARLRRATARRSGGAAVAAALVLAAGAAPTAAQGLVPEGSEFHVNTYTTSDQTLPAVAMATGGAFVVVWESDGQDGDSYGVFAQRHGAGGTSVGGAFRVNTHTTLYQGSPAVAMDADGDFVVTWMSAHDGAGSGIFAQRYDATGMPQGAEFPVSAGATLLRGFPSVAMDASGAFVVTWQSGAAGSDDVDIYARRYDAAGVPLGEEFE
ncbi:MAG TPA: hypothetical protein VK610_02065, partial [Rhodothermales bacterium]|nr:hypothetical protein [Rhodothermales bacterium]